MKEDHRTLNPFNEEDVADARLNDDDASRELRAYLPEHMSCFVWVSVVTLSDVVGSANFDVLPGCASGVL